MSKKPEIILKGRSVSQGVAFGKALSLYGSRRQFYKTKIPKTGVAQEIERFHESLKLAKEQLKKISSGGEVASRQQVTIFETHLLFLDDKSLLSKIEKSIHDDRINAEWAVSNVADSYISKYKNLSDKHLREKYIDLEDVALRLLVALGGGDEKTKNLNDDSIIVAKEVYPSTLIEFKQSRPAAIATESGGWTSHTFILARELGIPAVTGLKGVLRQVETGDNVVVDGFAGTLTLNPEKATLERGVERKSTLTGKREGAAYETGKLKTLDDVEITLRANLDLLGDYQEAESLGANGIGLYRSEFLFNQNRGSPGEDEQFEAYKRIAEEVGKSGVRIRTFDLGVEEVAAQSGAAEENNPALGLRAIRLSLRRESEFRIQLRALLRASYKRHLDVVFPMISDVSEMRKAVEMLSEERQDLISRGIKTGNPKVGAMIEVPATIFTIDHIARESDFVNIGTNDLVQHLLAADRNNESVAGYYRTLHPAVLKGIKTVLEECDRANTPATICGEMAGSPIYATVLLGLGARDLSMNPKAIPAIAETVSEITCEEAKEAAQELEVCATSQEVEEKVRKALLNRWPQLFDEAMFTQY